MSMPKTGLPRKKLQKGMIFMGALAEGTEKLQKQASKAVGFMAGKKVGVHSVSAVQQVDDPIEALNLLSRALLDMGIDWNFKPFKHVHMDSFIEHKDGKQYIYLVFKDCMIRNVLFHYGHAQKESLCIMSHGIFSGALEAIMPGYNVELEIEHAGPNSCYKVLTLAPRLASRLAPRQGVVEKQDDSS
ncbi:MAG: hypothetical protein GTO45_04970 [Candidatus Aminicenantes bacterium]|nr:hypothetical protein [Candidatus Aminicenantes bacterium]NIM78105.1 hypothetical protein [Candidatus Aminicenantes bacterium]NIN17423.1 hypothetical protein [Candidatus Aminicenantes bacterium]NIN41319.1 hypothetical protein [Candidatus Aminicenantes bacterium]NIN84089.1 hypothetical protein [Candidatus Aminicenantes bacterium]